MRYRCPHRHQSCALDCAASPRPGVDRLLCELQITRATWGNGAPPAAACECAPRLSIPVFRQASQETGSAPQVAQRVQSGKLAATRGVSPGPRADGKRTFAKAAGDKYAATVMQQPSIWRSRAARHGKAGGGAITLHPPASHGLQYQRSFHRNSSA